MLFENLKEKSAFYKPFIQKRKHTAIHEKIGMLELKLSALKNEIASVLKGHL